MLNRSSIVTASPQILLPVDFTIEGREIDVPLLRELALGRKRSSEIQLLLDGELEHNAHKSSVVNNGQMLALLLADVSVPEQKAAATFKHVIAHRNRLSAELRRPVGVKTAAMDYLENVERALKIKDVDDSLTYTQLTQMAFTDQLTGMANYRFFCQRLREEIRRCERYGHLLSLLMADLDFFKAFNDRHGHPAGNKALQHVARSMFAEVRDTDLLARYGGEEFALILPHTSKSEAQNLAERIRAHIESAPLELDDKTNVTLTICLGVATLPRDARNEDDLLEAADHALYQAKQTGRNRVCVYAPKTVAHFRCELPLQSNATMVGVVGDFNNWSVDDDPMQPVGERAFALDIPLAPGHYRYKYVLDGKEFMPDSRTTLTESDGHGGVNSIMVIE
ncbi:MAG: diguanylate cyclase [Planctomycetota bacterium]